MVLEGIREAVKKFLRSPASYEMSVQELVRDLQRTLIRADVNVKVVLGISENIKKRALEEKPPPGITRRDWILKIVYEELTKMFGGEREPEVKPGTRPYTIMMVGIQGSGKTTSAGKIAYYYKKRGYKVALVCADTYRPAAYEQLKTLGDKVGVPVYGEPSSKDPIGIARRGVEKFKRENYDIIVVDTAGRHKEEEGLLREMREIAEAIKPDEIMLVIDATIGQQALGQAEKFHKTTPIGSIFISKLDGTAKGGGALSAVAATGATVKFVGVGEDISEVELFSPPRFVSRIMGLGDLQSLIEKVREAEIERELTEKQMKAIISGKLTMRDLYHQIRSIRKMGPLSKVLQMIPGLSLTLPSTDQLKITEEMMDRWLAIIDSMTYDELDNPEIIDKSRIRRIAIGSGTRVEDVRELLRYYSSLKKLMKQIRRRRDLIRKLGLGL